MTDRTYTAQVAALLAMKGFSARVVTPRKGSSGVEIRLSDGEGAAIWEVTDGTWGYVVMSGVDGALTIKSSGKTSLAEDVEPERISWVIASFPYDDEMTEEEVHAAISDILTQVEGMSDDDREALLAQTIPSDVPEIALSWAALQESGLLWAINRQMLNPSGFNMSLRYESGEPVGWAITGTGQDPVQMDPLVDRHGAALFSTFAVSLVESAEG